MSVRNHIPSMSITHLENNSHVNFGKTTNRNPSYANKSLGSSRTIGENGMNLDFEKNLYIEL